MAKKPKLKRYFIRIATTDKELFDKIQELGSKNERKVGRQALFMIRENIKQNNL